MSIAQYNRGTRAIQNRFNRESRPVEFEIIDNLNAQSKYPDAGQVFANIQFSHDHRGWWAECRETGFAFFYTTLIESVRRWRVNIVSYKDGVFYAEPTTR